MGTTFPYEIGFDSDVLLAFSSCGVDYRPWF